MWIVLVALGCRLVFGSLRVFLLPPSRHALLSSGVLARGAAPRGVGIPRQLLIANTRQSRQQAAPQTHRPRLAGVDHQPAGHRLPAEMTATGARAPLVRLA